MATSSNEEISGIEVLKSASNFELWFFQINIFFKANALDEITNGIKRLDDLMDDKSKGTWIIKDAKAQESLQLLSTKPFLCIY